MPQVENPYRSGLGERTVIGQIVDDYFDGKIDREEYRNRLCKAVDDKIAWHEQQVEIEVQQKLIDEGFIDLE